MLRSSLIVICDLTRSVNCKSRSLCRGIVTSLAICEGDKLRLLASGFLMYEAIVTFSATLGALLCDYLDLFIS
jgi:hypothetical protein